MSYIIKHKVKDIFISIKEKNLGHITSTDIKFLRERFNKFETARYKKIPFYTGYAKIIYYNINKPEDFPQNKQWLRIKNKIDNSKYFLIGSTDGEYKCNGKVIKYYKYFRYYHDYHILELVSDYYNKIPIFYHLSDGVYGVVNNVEFIKGIDYI